MGDLSPMVALVLADIEPAGGGGEGEAVAALVDRQRVAIDEVVGVLLRQALARTSKLAPASRVRVTTSFPSTGMRRSSLIAGTNQAVSGSRGWTATAKPNEEGGTSTISRQLAEPSSLRKMPLWCCAHRRSGALGLCTTQCGSCTLGSRPSRAAGTRRTCRRRGIPRRFRRRASPTRRRRICRSARRAVARVDADRMDRRPVGARRPSIAGASDRPTANGRAPRSRRGRASGRGRRGWFRTTGGRPRPSASGLEREDVDEAVGDVLAPAVAVDEAFRLRRIGRRGDLLPDAAFSRRCSLTPKCPWLSTA